jgi:hypothetical protein
MTSKLKEHKYMTSKYNLWTKPSAEADNLQWKTIISTSKHIKTQHMLGTQKMAKHKNC